ncbi:Putative serine/threonine-protein kinase haspin homolog [Talaromyces islandicus]|uniref:non-specific serine/threonine protein kinase n=1 Tax=Talaromyces islandicus TaxID=28573 RepID=A0A0U1LLY8_TALIS|nr:Putative serine/threonine-protein kinase haspin homolog [Talaromyces islandicus]
MPTTRTVQQKRVYGKRRANAPRAVLENGSPLKFADRASASVDQSTDTESEEDVIKEMESELAALKLEEESWNPPESTEQTVPATPLVRKTRRKSVLKTPMNRLQEQAARNLPSPKSDSPATAKQTTSIGQEEQRRLSFTPRQPRPKPTQTRRPATRLSSGCVENEKLYEYVGPVLQQALSSFSAQGVQKFSSWAARCERAFDPIKIAEGSYGEVYKLRLREDICKNDISKSKLKKLRAYGEGVFKIVPLRSQKGPGSKKFTSIDEMAAEVKLLKLLDPVPGFARFREIHVVQGRFPPSFQKAWDTYKDTKDDCMNPNPANKRAYNNNQLWAILEMDDAGVELEKFSWSSVFQVYDIFWGVAMGLARAEEFALFEHRDLHLGNICLRSTRSDGDMQSLAELDAHTIESSSGFGISSLETTIIDYSLSRAELRFTDNPEEKVDVASTDLDSKQLFDAIGRDEDEILLRNTYRYMRSQLYNGNSQVSEKPPNIPGIWAEYAPKTNLIWLLFILKNMMKNIQLEDFTKQGSKKPLQPCKRKANQQIDSSTSRDCSKPKSKTASSGAIGGMLMSFQKTINDRLNKILQVLDLEHGREDMCCAADLVAYAIDQGWLDGRDFFLA